MLSSVRQNKTLIIGVVGVLLILVSLAKATANINKYKKNFRDEMAERLDLEEKLDKMEKGRAVVIQFKEVQAAKPEKAQFEPPEGFARYTDVKTLMMQRMNGAGGSK